MFDIGFGELLIIAVLGLLVLGPERLPVAVKTIGLWVGRFKRSYRQIRNDIEQEIGADEIRRQADNFVDLATLRGEIARQHSGERPTSDDSDDDYEDYDE